MQGRVLTPKQRKALEFIKSFSEGNGYSPSLREIAKFFKKPLSSAQHFVEELQARGYLHKEENIARGITPTSERLGRIFKLGYIHAGEPIEAIENPEPVDVPVSMLQRQGDYYALQVRGTSMIEDNILSGDLIVVRYQHTADDGDKVVAIVDNGATLKKFYNLNGKVELRAANKQLKGWPRQFNPGDIEIRGVFCGLIREDRLSA